MKSIKRIAGLSVVVISIIGFWLMPRVNQAKDERYTRIYEDVSYRAVSDTTRSKKSRNLSVKKLAPPPIVYKTETIKAGLKLRDVDAQKFSRAIQFEPEEDLVLEEKVLTIAPRTYKVTMTDSTGALIVRIDTLFQPEFPVKISANEK